MNPKVVYRKFKADKDIEIVKHQVRKMYTHSGITSGEKRNNSIKKPIGMYKIYTSILNYFLEDHCRVNNILSIEQAAAKKRCWGCTDQLLINKAIMEEVKFKRRTSLRLA